MNLDELLEKLNHYKGFYKNKKFRVVVKTNNKSVGASSSVDVDDVYTGIDWDDGTLFINPKEKLVRADLNRDVVLAPIDFNKKFPYLADPTSNKKVWICKNCEERVSIKDNYCKNCGQKLKERD